MKKSRLDYLAQLNDNREQVAALVEKIGVHETRKLLNATQEDLNARIRAQVKGGSKDRFTTEQSRIILRQVRHVQKLLNKDIKQTLVDSAGTVADRAAGRLIDYLGAAEAHHTSGAQPLRIREAAVLHRAAQGAQASVLRRLASSGEPVANADDMAHPAKEGVLTRYSLSTIDTFENILQRGIVTGKSVLEMKTELHEQMPFVNGKPAGNAERIVRTEVAGAYQRAAWESMRAADDQLGDMCKILSATFDDRTGWDSYNVHGEARYIDQPFEYVDYKGRHVLFMTPPNRPYDREDIVPHRVSWGPPPDELQPMSREATRARFMMQTSKKEPKPFPGFPRKMSTVKFQ